MSQTLADFAERRRRAADVLAGLADTLAALELDAGPARDRLADLAARARSGRFLVLLLGGFSSGKSTLLNALLGQPVLPVKVNPCTAILTELAYGEQATVEVRFRDGRPAEALTPAAFLARYQLSAAEAQDAGAEATDRFGAVDRAVVSWPLPLLRDGVALLDTPGLDDDEARTERTLASLPQADAVIVVLNATRFLSDLERRTIRRHLLPLGLTNLFFPVTMVDLLDALTDHPERDLAEMRRRAQQMLGPLCEVRGEDRFDERFFFLDARGALGARWDRQRATPHLDPQRLAASGIQPFERALEAFLVHERGLAQLGHLATAAARIHDELALAAQLDRATASASVGELRARQEQLEPQFRELAAIAERVRRTVDAFVTRQGVRVGQDLRQFLADAEERLPEAVSGFDLGGLAGLDLITPSGRRRLEERLQTELETWLTDQVAAWQRSLEPKLVTALDQLRAEVAGDAHDFETLSAGIVTDFAGGLLAVPGLSTGERMDPVERWFSVAVGAVLLSPGAMAAGWTEGYEGALKGAAGRLAARVAIVALGALLGPVGWLGLALYAITDAVLLVLTGGGRLKRLREQLARELSGKLVAQADLVREPLAERVRVALEPLRDGVVAAAEAEAEALRDLLARTIHAREEAARGATERAQRWDEALAALGEGTRALDALARTDGEPPRAE